MRKAEQASRQAIGKTTAMNAAQSLIQPRTLTSNDEKRVDVI